MNYEEYIKRIEETYSSDAFDELGKDLDEDDSLTPKERHTLKVYAFNLYRCTHAKSHTYSFKGKEIYVGFSNVLSEFEKKKFGYEPHSVARLVLRDRDENDNLILTQITTIVIKPGLEIKAYHDSLGLLEGDELKVLFYPRGQPEA